jgi:FdhE protein
MNFINQRLRRLEELQQKRPQFGEVLAFYQALYNFFQAQNQPFLLLTADRASASRRSEQGFPLLDAGSLAFDPAGLKNFLSGLLALLQEHGAQGGDDLERLRQGLTAGEFDPAALLVASFSRQREPLVKAAERLEVAPALLAFLLDLTLSFVLRAAVEQAELPPVPNWQEGLCPTCGGVPAMGEICGEEGRRRLHCGSCGTVWTFSRHACPFCGHREEREKEYFTAGDERGYRVDLCRACNCYLKVVDDREVGHGLPLDIEDVTTLYLDILAQREGFTQGKQPLS